MNINFSCKIRRVDLIGMQRKPLMQLSLYSCHFLSLMSGYFFQHSSHFSWHDENVRRSVVLGHEYHCTSTHVICTTRLWEQGSQGPGPIHQTQGLSLSVRPRHSLLSTFVTAFASLGPTSLCPQPKDSLAVAIRDPVLYFVHYVRWLNVNRDEAAKETVGNQS
jgi:hypothetical protein